MSAVRLAYLFSTSGIEGSVVYKLVHQTGNATLTFEWRNPVVGDRCFSHKVSPDKFRKHFDINCDAKDDAKYRIVWTINTNLEKCEGEPPANLAPVQEGKKF